MKKPHVQPFIIRKVGNRKRFVVPSPVRVVCMNTLLNGFAMIRADHRDMQKPGMWVYRVKAN